MKNELRGHSCHGVGEYRLVNRWTWLKKSICDRKVDKSMEVREQMSKVKTE
jgi:hypothetical protein